MLKFVVRSGGNNSTEEQRVNVKKDIVAPIINDIDLLCNVVKRNTAVKAASTKTGPKYNSNWEKTHSWQFVYK